MPPSSDESSPEGMALTDSELKNPAESELVSRFVGTQDSDVQSLLPPQKNTSLEELLAQRQEETRSELATFLIKILAGTLAASFFLLLVLVLMPVFVDESKANNLSKNMSLVKDLVMFILTAQTGLIGTALGFYFGSQSNTSRGKTSD